MVRYNPKNAAKQMSTKRRKKDLDEVYEDLNRVQNVTKIKTRLPDPDLPALGNIYCVVCNRYFASQPILDTHCKTKGHKKKCKNALKETPHGINLEDVYGKKVDNGIQTTTPIPDIKEPQVTSVKAGTLWEIAENVDPAEAPMNQGQ